jgi:hypothetical protein
VAWSDGFLVESLPNGMGRGTQGTGESHPSVGAKFSAQEVKRSTYLDHRTWPVEARTHVDARVSAKLSVEFDAPTRKRMYLARGKFRSATVGFPFSFGDQVRRVIRATVFRGEGMVNGWSLSESHEFEQPHVDDVRYRGQGDCLTALTGYNEAEWDAVANRV